MFERGRESEFMAKEMLGRVTSRIRSLHGLA